MPILRPAKSSTRLSVDDVIFPAPFPTEGEADGGDDGPKPIMWY